MAQICKEEPIGWMNGIRQQKGEWGNDGFGGTPSFTLRCRDTVYTAFAELCGPDDILDTLWIDVQNCIRTAVAASALTAIFASPAAATPAFASVFQACLNEKLGDRINEIGIHLTVRDTTGDWGPC